MPLNGQASCLTSTTQTGFRAHSNSIDAAALGFRVTPPVDHAGKRGHRIFALGASTTEGRVLGDIVGCGSRRRPEGLDWR